MNVNRDPRPVLGDVAGIDGIPDAVEAASSRRLRGLPINPSIATARGVEWVRPRISWPAAHLGLPGLESTFRENSRVVLALQHPTTCVRSGSEHGVSHRCRRLGEVALTVAWIEAPSACAEHASVRR